MKPENVPHTMSVLLWCCVLLFQCTQIDFDYDEGDDAPVITLLGPDPYPLNIGDPYNEPGARASDYQDGDLSSDIVIDNSSIDPYTESDYIVTYTVSDKDGFTATSQRRVSVKDGVGTDKEKPELLLNGDNPYQLYIGETYVDPGATATDNVDGNISNKIQVYDAVITTSVVDTHTVYYVVSDSAGNVAMATRAVIVLDTTGDYLPPVITLKGPNPVNLQVGYAYTEYGATAIDNVDGDLTVEIIIDNLSVNTSEVGTYTVSYTVSDAAGNKAEEYRTVNVTSNIIDSIPPVISLQGDNPVMVYVDSAYVDPGATATDDIDGDITSNIVIDESQVNTSVEGSFIVTYSVSDAGGNSASAERKVNVVPENFVDTLPPVITLQGPNPVNLGNGFPYVEHGATATDNIDGDCTGNISIDTSELNVTVEGSYNVYYRVSDKAGNKAEKIRVVNILGDNTPPVITLKGKNPMPVQINQQFIDPGATAIDDIDGDISDKITTSGTVNTSVEGSYTVTYKVSDKAGNSASKDRTVNVVTTGIQLSESDNNTTVFSINEETTYSIPFGNNKTFIINKTTECNIDVSLNGGNFKNWGSGTWYCSMSASSGPDNKLSVTIKPRSGTARFTLQWTPW